MSNERINFAVSEIKMNGKSYIKLTIGNAAFLLNETAAYQLAERLMFAGGGIQLEQIELVKEVK